MFFEIGPEVGVLALQIPFSIGYERVRNDTTSGGERSADEEHGPNALVLAFEGILDWRKDLSADCGSCFSNSGRLRLLDIISKYLK